MRCFRRHGGICYQLRIKESSQSTAVSFLFCYYGSNNHSRSFSFYSHLGVIAFCFLSFAVMEHLEGGTKRKKRPRAGRPGGFMVIDKTNYYPFFIFIMPVVLASGPLFSSMEIYYLYWIITQYGHVCFLLFRACFVWLVCRFVVCLVYDVILSS